MRVFLFANGLALPIPAPEAEISCEAALKQLLRNGWEGVRREKIMNPPNADGPLLHLKQGANGLCAAQGVDDVGGGIEITMHKMSISTSCRCVNVYRNFLDIKIFVDIFLVKE